MQLPDILLGLAAFVLTPLVLARTARWIQGLVAAIKEPSTTKIHSRSALFVVMFLHSGPWVLAVAVAGIWIVATSSRPIALWAVVMGSALSAALIGTVAVRAIIRRRRQASPSPPVPLTPERLLQLRRRFFRINVLVFAVAMPVGGAAGLPDGFRRDLVHLLILLFAGLLMGWIWSWFMWQWYGASLEVQEKRRLKREAAAQADSAEPL